MVKLVFLVLGTSLKSVDQRIPSLGPTNLSFGLNGSRKVSGSKRALVIQASYSDGGRPSGAGIFIGGFVLGGLVVGTLSCVCAPQISKALAGADKKDLMKKLPKFIYDEEKVLEKQRQKLAEKIEQLNSAIDNVSTQLRSDDPPNGEAVNSDEVESVV
ncbi:Localized to the inner membrane of the chloroplast [Olea europaea subsp. europaea]|uniref:Localized to the inner membrane of the chloroplast n=1 Tax=Olea europaea subsp. europaea TaxID=158383 RepID=A0A8S0TJG7_OLEEU|nr:Localized to the inner membrane of the chloroplast [Olea europaea subsp. europaea]